MTLTLWVPQIIMTAMLVLGSGISLGRYGQRKTDCYNQIDIFGPIGVIALLWWGGFYG